MNAILALPFVDRTRVVIGGQSRGGILSVAYAGRHAEQVKGVINFVGGWNGARCEHAATINQSIFVRGARYPRETIWLYGDDDPFYPLSHSRASFAAFLAAGRVSRAAGRARRPLHLETAGSVGTARRGLPEAIGLAERRELGADARQPITRPPITRIESPVT